MPATFSNIFRVCGDTGGFIRVIFQDQAEPGTQIQEVGSHILKIADAKSLRDVLTQVIDQTEEMQSAQNSTRQ